MNLLRLFILCALFLAVAHLESTEVRTSQGASECVTDSECAELCPEGTRDLPIDHPDYCDGGPQS